MVIEETDIEARLEKEFRNHEFRPESVRRFLAEVVKRLRPGKGFGRQEAEQIALTTLERVYDAIDHFRGDCPFFAWVMIIANRVKADHHKEIHKLDTKTDDLLSDDTPFDLDDIDSAQAKDMSSADLTQRLYESDEAKLLKFGCEDALDSLTEEERQLVTLRIDEERSFKEMADVVGSTPGALERRLARTILPKVGRYLVQNGWVPEPPAC